MELTNEKINALNEKIKSLEAKKKIEQRKIRDEQRKRDQRRFYVIGEIVVEYFPRLKEITPGSKADTGELFSGFESFLKAVSSDEKYARLFQDLIQRKPENNGNV